MLRAFEVDPETFELVTDKKGQAIPLSLDKMTYAPTAYYSSLPMYVFGTEL